MSYAYSYAYWWRVRGIIRLFARRIYLVAQVQDLFG